jgi:hypothetical protein
MHEGVDLKLGLVKCVIGGRDHVSVDDLSDSRVQTHLGRGENSSVKVRTVICTLNKVMPKTLKLCFVLI